MRKRIASGLAMMIMVCIVSSYVMLPTQSYAAERTMTNTSTAFDIPAPTQRCARSPYQRRGTDFWIYFDDCNTRLLIWVSQTVGHLGIVGGTATILRQVPWIANLIADVGAIGVVGGIAGIANGLGWLAERWYGSCGTRGFTYSRTGFPWPWNLPKVTCGKTF